MMQKLKNIYNDVENKFIHTNLGMRKLKTSYYLFFYPDNIALEL